MVEIEKGKAAASKKTLNQEDIMQMKADLMKDYEKQASVYHSSSRLWDDGVILPENTR